jgi:23S rRNA pseudouridine2605 synthase
VTAPKRFGLARTISKLGYCSRSQAVALIKAKRVSVSGRVVRDAELPVLLPPDRIEIDGAPLERHSSVYLVMNKPAGFVTTASDEKGRKTVYDLLGQQQAWVAPVGRLDKASEGLLLLTNDSAWAAKVTDPDTHLDKLYHVQINRISSSDLPEVLVRGCRVNGEQLRAKHARLLRQGEKNCWLEITLDEGKNRQIRRLLYAIGIRVLRLVRVAIGPLELGDLEKGQTRPLTMKEKRAIDRALLHAY